MADTMKLFQITEDDLAELERLVPELCWDFAAQLDNRTRTKFRRCQTILSNVRWGYGPPEHVETIPAGPDNSGD